MFRDRLISIRVLLGNPIRALKIPPQVLIVAAMGLLVFLGWKHRLPLLPIESADFTNALNPWYNYIRDNGFSAFGVHFYQYTYTPTYPYLFWVFQQFFPGVENIVAIKMISYVFDVLLAVAVYFVVRLYRREPLPLIAFSMVIFWPTVVLNSAAWGQCDAIYTTFIVASLYFALQRRMLLACVMFGIGFSVKLQSVFAAPFLLLLALRGEMKWRYLLAIPGVYVVMMIPAWLMGRPLNDLLLIYYRQYDAYHTVSYGAPNMYQLLPPMSAEEAKALGLLTALALAAVLTLYGSRRQALLEGKNLILVALFSAALLPFTLPRMMYRYFFVADMLSIVLAFYFPRFFVIPLLIEFASLYSYPHFVPMRDIPIQYLSAANLTALGLLAALLLHQMGHSPLRPIYALLDRIRGR